ncbi:MAG: hypothetical protein KJ922_04995, partial [Nanoarchaeota archaeon]|nr:hypothetical protein [Nanoarchaeota archaeon]
LGLMKKLGVRYEIVLNRSDIGDRSLITRIAKKFQCKLAAEVPYDKNIIDAYSKGKPIENKEIQRLVEQII